MFIKSAQYLHQKSVLGIGYSAFCYALVLMMLTKISQIASLEDAVQAKKINHGAKSSNSIEKVCRKLVQIRYQKCAGTKMLKYLVGIWKN